MWLGLLFDTNATLQGEGDALSEGSVAFCIAGVAFFREVMHLGRSVMHWGEACFTGGGVLHLLSTRWGRSVTISGFSAVMRNFPETVNAIGSIRSTP